MIPKLCKPKDLGILYRNLFMFCLACSYFESLHFQKRNKPNKYTKFIMGVLAQAKNGDEQFWNIEISCSQWEGSACTQSALIFFF